MEFRDSQSSLAIMASLALLAACSNSDMSVPSLTAGGHVSGLKPSQSVVLSISNGSTVTVAQNGTYTFSSKLSSNASYSVQVAQQPVGETCTVSQATGSGVTSNVSNIDVTCSSLLYSVTGNVAGLATGATVVLSNNASDAVNIQADGPFKFDAPINYNGTYAVTVTGQPDGQTCTVSNGNGTGVTSAVTHVAVACEARSFAVSGTASGLGVGEQLTVLNNGADPLVVSANGSFSFSTPVAWGGGFAVTLNQQPAGKTCSVSQGSGSNVAANVANVVVSCSLDSYTVGGAVSGLASGAQVTLYDNGGDAAVVPANGAFGFATPVAWGGNYAVTVNQQPLGQTCTVSQGTGADVTSDVASVAVNCTANTYAIGGQVSGLASGGMLGLTDNGVDPIAISADGAFVFPAALSYGSSFAVSVAQQPSGQTCTASQNTGLSLAADVTTVAVTCSVDSYSIGGVVSGLTSGTSVTLADNGGDTTVVNADGTFTFATPVSFGGSYAVTVSQQPSGETCTVSQGSGTNLSADQSNVAVTCSATNDILASLQFAQGEVADAQWNVQACTTTATCQIYADTPGTAYKTPFTSGRFDFTACGAGSYVKFSENLVNGMQDPTNPWAEGLYGSNGTLCQAGGTGHFVIVGDDAQNVAYLFYVGSDNNTGTLVSPYATLTGAGLSFTGVSHPTLAQVNSYLH